MSSATVLLVEDAHSDVLLVRRAFARAGLAATLHVVGGGDAAVAYLSGEAPYDDRERHPSPDLVLLDLKLPRRSGMEVLTWLRGQPGLRRVPVAILTSSKDVTDVDRAYDAGANSYLVKPVGFEPLLELVKAVGLYWVDLNERPRL